MVTREIVRTAHSSSATVLNHEQWSNWAYSLHIWFLKQMVTRRGMEWTEVLICNKRVRSCCAVFGESQVFTQLKRASANIPSLDAFAVMGDRVCSLRDLRLSQLSRCRHLTKMSAFFLKMFENAENV